MASIAKFAYRYTFRWQSHNGRTIRIYDENDQLIGSQELPGTENPTPTRVARWVDDHGLNFIRAHRG